MNFEYSDNGKAWLERVRAFMEQHIYPNEARYEAEAHEGDRWKVLPVIEELKPLAKKAGLWNMFLNICDHDTGEWKGPGLTNLEYAPLAEEMGRVGWSSEIFNCSAPDTGNMEVLRTYGTEAQKAKWLRPLMDGTIRSAFLMTEPGVASSDATNIETSIVRDGNEYVINGRKWWSSGAGDPRCAINIVMGKTDPNAPRHSQQSQILVPMDAPGVTKLRALKVFGYDDAPHGHFEMLLENVRVPLENIILGEGRGFEIAQGRLGPGRIHHCMRSIGAAESALEKMCKRLKSRVAFGRPVSDQGVWHERIADARIAIEQARLLTLKAAYMMDTVGNKAAAREIAMIKVIVPNMSTMVIDMAIQAHGGGGVCQDFGLASSYAGQRTLRIADGPDEVHRAAIAKGELRRYN
jgi:acyl-CoA dehydrogenase